MKGDITRIEADAIVNAANSSLMGGGGVDGAIHRAGGSSILEECRFIVGRIGECQPGDAVMTTAGALPARYVIHTVGPVWEGGKNRETETLISCYKKCLQMAASNELESIVFPNISTGVYNYPKDEAAAIAVNTTIDFLLENPVPARVIFCCYDRDNYNWTHYYLDNFLKQS